MDLSPAQLYFGSIGALALTILALTSAGRQKRLSSSGFLMLHILIAALTYVGWNMIPILSERSDQLRSFLD